MGISISSSFYRDFLDFIDKITSQKRVRNLQTKNGDCLGGVGACSTSWAVSVTVWGLLLLTGISFLVRRRRRKRNSYGGELLYLSD